MSRPSWRLAAALLAAALLAAACDARAQVAPPDDARYAASSLGRVYYWIGCDAWRRLKPANLIFFRSAAEAEAQGYRPSRTAGCGRRPDEAASPGDRAMAGRDSTARGARRPHEAAPPADAPRPDTASSAGPAGPPDAPTLPCTVQRIVDGDTIQCGEGERVRLLLIDTPELSQRPFGRAAREALAAMLPVGSRARLELDVQERDRYGRVLAYVYDARWRMVNEALVRAGYAVVLVYPPNVKYVERMRAAAAAAREARRGLWATPAFECLPAEHRRGRCER